MKITVPKYNYKAYCPANRNDLMNLLIREEDIIEMFCPEEGDIFVDIGAHHGRYTLLGSRRVCNSGKVVSIEADPLNFDLLNKNIKLNGLTNVTSLNYAAYSRQDDLKLHLRSDDISHSIYHSVMSNRLESAIFREVKAETLDKLLQLQHIDLKAVNWIKIDVEGAELEVLKGAHNTLTQSSRISLLIEIHRLSDGTLYQPIKEFLMFYNFKIVFEKVYGGGERHIIARKQN